jgi:choline dehydrogenase-like flavoprotein
VAAARLARAGVQVAVLERGREFLPGDFPAVESAFVREVQVDAPTSGWRGAARLADGAVRLPGQR